jgi:dinuclear metal center YbgI/SA1388 family protein
MKAIKHDIAIYAMHTALDNAFNGVNGRICDVLGLSNKQILIPQEKTIKKLSTYVPTSAAESLRNALFAAGAGTLGNYDSCSFNTDGIGTFKGNAQSNPIVGTRGTLHQEKETQLNLTFQKHKEDRVLKALFTAHPYEEVAYEITTLENKNQHIGMGMIGEFPDAMEEMEFLLHVKSKMNTECIRHSDFCKQPIKKVAVLGGSGSFAIAQAKSAGAQAFITADLKYHQFYEAENKLILVDIGHYESEQYTKNLLVEHLTKKIANFAVVLSQQVTNPIKYL